MYGRRCLPLLLLVAVVLLVPGCFSGKLRLPELVVGTPTPGPTGQPAAAPTVASLRPYGRILYAQAGRIWLWQDGTAHPLTNGPGDTQPSWSPDGRRIAYVTRGESSSGLYTRQVERGSLEQPMAYGAPYANVWVYRPTWSPNGKILSFLSDLNAEDMAVWTVDATAGGGWRRLVASGWQGGIDSFAWSPDGKRLVIGGFRSNTEQVWLYTLASGQWRQLTNARDGAYDPRFSPDGTRVAYVVREAGKHDVWTMAADGSDQVRLTDDGGSRSPAWSPGGEYVAFLSVRGGTFDVWVTAGVPQSAAGRGPAPLQLTRNQNVDSLGGLSWSR